MLFLIGLGTLGLLVGCDGAEEITESEIAVAVRAEVVEPVTREIVTTYTGSLEGERQAVLYSKLAEAVDSVLVREGQAVAANTVLVKLDQTGPSTGYREALSRFQNAEKNYKKMQYLFKEGAVAESEFDAAETEYEVAQAGLEAIRRLVAVQTPIAGVVTAVNVSAGDFVTVGHHLATVATTERLLVKFAVNAEELAGMARGASMRMASDAAADTAFGTIARVASSADPVTRTFQVEALIDNSRGTFKPGMFVRIIYVRETLENVLTLPTAAVMVLEGKPTVYTVSGDRARRQEITLGPDLLGEQVVEFGLQPGDTVVTLGQDYLSDSTLVNITELNGSQS